MNFKKEIATLLGVQENLIAASPKEQMGDFSFACFSLAKEMGKAPNLIAQDYKEKLAKNLPPFVEKVEVIGGYLNFFLNKPLVAPMILADAGKEFEYNDFGAGQTVCIDYCSPNLAKFMHIGHFTNLAIGESLRRIYEKMGFDVKRICYVGDYGTPFGKMVVAIKEWGNLQDVKSQGIEAIQNLYIEFAKREEENENLIEMARQASKNIEEKHGIDYEIYKEIINVAIDECKGIVAKVGVEFDDWRGESTYSNSIKPMVENLLDKNIARKENGAVIVDLTEDNLHVAVVQRSDGGSVYLTRDLCAVEDRFSLYNFSQMLYVVGQEQKNHFSQLFRICSLLDKPYANSLKHITYGLFSMPEGKISSRKGKQALFTDLYNEGVASAKEVVKDKKFEFEKVEDVITKVARSSIAFSILKVERNKEKVFDKDKIISFDGETAPYVQYTYARTCSLERKFRELDPSQNEKLPNEEIAQIYSQNFKMYKILNNLDQMVKLAYDRAEPCYIAREIVDLCQEFNKFYHNVKILNEKNYGLSSILMQTVLAIKGKLAEMMPLVMLDLIEEM